jgi:hypothetical protein
MFDVMRFCRPSFDGSFLILLFLATAIVMYAAYLSSADERHLRLLRLARASGRALEARPEALPGEDELLHETLTLSHALGFIGMASASLLLLYFFMQYLIYVLLALYCFGGLHVSFRAQLQSDLYCCCCSRS